MAKKRTKISAKKLSKKIAKVRRDDPTLTARQATGKAAGITRGGRKKRKR